MTHHHKITAALLLFCLLLSALVACGGPDPDEEIVGADWRTWGIIDDFGTIVRDGAEIPVCVCLHSVDASFYYDDPQQTYFDGVVYPEEYPETEWSNAGISFDDIDGDGQSDVLLKLCKEDGTEAALVWFYTPDGYAFREDYSAR